MSVGRAIFYANNSILDTKRSLSKRGIFTHSFSSLQYVFQA